MPFFHLGLNTFKVPTDFHANNRAKILNKISQQSERRTTNPKTSNNKAIILLKGGTNLERNDTDHEPIFRQESYFHYLFGVKEPDFWGAIDVESGKTTLFAPRLPPEYATIMGKILTTEDIAAMYYVEECRYVDELEDYLLLKGHKEKLTLYLMEGRNSDSGNLYQAPSLPSITTCTKDKTTLFSLLAESRVIKTAQELQLLRHVAELSSEAHVEVMRHTQPGMTEWQLEATFRHYTYYYYGCRNVGYTPICACGPSSAVLHYGHAGAPNARTLTNSDMCLLDMGTEYHCYGSDITCSFPANGTFNATQRIVYEGVLQAQAAVLRMLKPGVDWVECHFAAERAVLQAMMLLGVVVSTSNIEKMIQNRLGAVFMPHGLGHFIGIDTHDVGGYLAGAGHPPRSPLPGLKKLRTARIMEQGMVVTVEPGCYFIDHLLDGALEDDVLKQYLVPDGVNRLRGSGGVRLEDVVVVTEDGCDNFTRCPRTVKEVEHVMGGGKWPPVSDEAPDLKRSRLTAV
uniref:Xaa-Pro dipeptidase n=1 Tax=Leptocylindrus danicus TaxID=163516 RepID=A0A7S2L8F1_9STRA|mmetsp:Transcript_32559/g.47155  ORF Transcript_32559/g.47155 Transcript_32559/m.47155 type:complete len:514 (+) Transcript_32559:115-1656(+)|eukprot:CAMPEP_0116021034 /NCGR_PEP_ID=MMETSP0321-20121206/10147_1 /TAXON_ID=163516 /ORGANISM="Leptocylindrus danicus var. danicus, Strain B650" /LENGTH=513 /DNA_ID=CAMNT_0003491829 /DNA_START=74 /DNA_END=1618 /DNA_ORIENTATION=-